MGDGDRIDVIVGAQTGELKAGMGESQSLVQRAMAGVQNNFREAQQGVTQSMSNMQSQVKSSLDGVSSALTMVGKVAVGVGALLAGGALFKDLIQSTVDYVTEAKKLHETTNININDAAGMILAYKRVGVDSDALGQALKRFMMQVKTNSEGLKKYGLDVDEIRAQGGGLMDMFEKSKEIVAGYTKGYDQQQAMLLFWGARVQDGTKILKVHTEQVADASKFLKSLGLSIGPEMEAQIRQFKQGLVDTETLLLALKFVIAQQLVPELIKLQGWLAGEGGSAIKTFTTTVNGLASAFGALKISIGWIYDSLNVWEKWNKAAQATQKVINLAKGIPLYSGDMGAGSHGGDWGLPKPAPAGGGDKKWVSPPGGGGGGGGGGGKGGGGLFQEWQQELTKIKEEENRFLESSKQEERQFWLAKLQLCREGSQEYVQVRRQLSLLNKQIAKEELQLELADLKIQMESEKNSVEQRLRLNQEGLNKIAAAMGKNSMDYKRALQEKVRFEREAQKEIDQLKLGEIQKNKELALIDLEMERQNAAAKRQMGILSATQEIQRLKTLKQQEWQIEKQALERERLLQSKKPQEIDQINKKIEIGERKHQLEMQKLNQQGVAAFKAQWDQFFNSFGSGFTQALQGLWQGTQTFGELISNFMQNMLSTLLNMVAQWATEYVATLLYVSIFGRVSALERVTQESGVAFAAAYASICAIPIVGPFLAPAVASASALGAFAGGSALASAAQGWDVPSDAFAFVHAKEMILPPDLAERVRRMTGAGSPGTHIEHINFSPTLVIKQPMTHAYAEELTRKFLMPAFQNELDRYGVNLGGG